MDIFLGHELVDRLERIIQKNAFEFLFPSY